MLMDVVLQALNIAYCFYYGTRFRILVPVSSVERPAFVHLNLLSTVPTTKNIPLSAPFTDAQAPSPTGMPSLRFPVIHLVFSGPASYAYFVANMNAVGVAAEILKRHCVNRSSMWPRFRNHCFQQTWFSGQHSGR